VAKTAKKSHLAVCAPAQELIPRKPNEYTPEIVEAICLRLADRESLRSICRDPTMPRLPLVYDWLNTYPDFVKRYARACELRTEAYFEEYYEAATDGSNDWYDRQIYNAKGELVRTERTVDPEVVARSRLRCDALKWMMGKLNPKKYGDKLDLNLGGQADNPVQVTQVPFGALDPIEAARRYQELMGPATKA
jgi:hypothetical protein